MLSVLRKVFAKRPFVPCLIDVSVLSSSYGGYGGFHTLGNTPTALEKDSTGFELGEHPIVTRKDTNLQRSNAVLVSIEGNIGAGKSTLLAELRKINPSWIFIDEPVGIWSNFRNSDGESMLELFYNDRRRWSYTFQNCALLTRFQNIEATISKHCTTPTDTATTEQEKKVFITERCLDTDFEVFTKMLHAEGSIDSLEYDLYVRWFQQLKVNATPLSAIVLLETSPSICYERIKRRAREGEDAIPLEYLQQIEKQQQAWVQNTDVPCLLLQETATGTDMDTTHGVANVGSVSRFVENIVAGQSSSSAPLCV